MKGFIGEDLRLRIAGRLAMGLQAQRVDWTMLSAGKGRTKKWEENEENIEEVHEQIQSFHETEMKKGLFVGSDQKRFSTWRQDRSTTSHLFFFARVVCFFN